MNLGRIGIWWSGWQPDDGIDAAAQDMEDAGYGAIWVSGGFRPGVSRRFERLLAASETLIVASGIINTWFTPAAELASAVAALEEQFPGRFLLGLGASHAPVIDGSGYQYERPVEQVVGFLDELDAAEPSVPADRRVLAALGPRMLRLSAERSLGAHPYFVPVEHTAFAREVLGQGPLLAPEVAVVLETDASAARDAARGYMNGYLGLPNYVNNLRRLGYGDDDFAGGASDRLVDAVVPWGSAAGVADRIREHLDAGADHVCVQIVGAGEAFPSERYQELAGALAVT